MKLAQYPGTVVRGGIVEENDLEVVVTLREDRLQAQAQVIAVVVVGHDDAYQRRIALGGFVLLVAHGGQQARLRRRVQVCGLDRQGPVHQPENRPQQAPHHPGRPRVAQAHAVVHQDGLEPELDPLVRRAVAQAPRPEHQAAQRTGDAPGGGCLHAAHTFIERLALFIQGFTATRELNNVRLELLLFLVETDCLRRCPRYLTFLRRHLAQEFAVTRLQ